MNKLSEKEYGTILLFIKSVPIENALMLLQHSISYKSQECAEKCIEVIASHFGYVAQKKFGFEQLPAEILLRILRNPNLRVFSEDDIFTVIMGYLSSQVGESPCIF